MSNHVLITWRKGTIDDPYTDITESVSVVNNISVLKEIPDEFTHVSISGMTETNGPIDNNTKFQCDYLSGILTFNPSKNGSLITVTYKGRGTVRYYADRIVSHNSTTDTWENLQGVIDNGQVAINALGQVQATINNAESATANASSFKWRGVWSNTTAYSLNEMVNYNGASYICKLAHTNQVPAIGGTIYWDVLSEKATLSSPIVDDTITIRKSTDTTKNVTIQMGTSGGIEFIINN